MSLAFSMFLACESRNLSTKTQLVVACQTIPVQMHSITYLNPGLWQGMRRLPHCIAVHEESIDE